MEYSKTKQGNLRLTFESPINVDNGYTNEPQGTFKSEMELFTDNNGKPHLIEWYVPKLDELEHIGIFFEGKTLVDYDGVFELPKEAIKLIRKAGYKVPKHFEL